MTGPDRRTLLPGGLTALAGMSAVACCAVPLLLATGLLGGAGWILAGQIMPGIVLALTAAAAATWWHTRRRTDCPPADHRPHIPQD